MHYILHFQNACILSSVSVHGFAHARYTLREGETLSTSFIRDVKGATQFPLLQLNGMITSKADTAGENTQIYASRYVHLLLSITVVEFTDFVSVSVSVSIHGIQNVHRNGAEFIDVVEVSGEFLRHVAIVKIIDNDCKLIY